MLEKEIADIAARGYFRAKGSFCDCDIGHWIVLFIYCVKYYNDSILIFWLPNGQTTFN